MAVPEKRWCTFDEPDRLMRIRPGSTEKFEDQDDDPNDDADTCHD